MASARPKTKCFGSIYQLKLYEEKYKAIKNADSGIKKSAVANKLGIPLNTLSTWLKNREKIKEAVTQNTVVGQRKRQRVGQFEDMEEALLHWFRDTRKNNVPINGPLVCSKAQQFSEHLQVNGFKCSVGWLNRFKARHGFFFFLGRFLAKRRQLITQTFNHGRTQFQRVSLSAINLKTFTTLMRVLCFTECCRVSHLLRKATLVLV